MISRSWWPVSGQAPRSGGWGHWLARLCHGGLRPNPTPSLYLWAGESGLGKSTLVHSLFLTDLYKDRKLLSAEGEWTPSFPGTGSPSPPVKPLKECPSRCSPPSFSPQHESSVQGPGGVAQTTVRPCDQGQNTRMDEKGSWLPEVGGEGSERPLQAISPPLQSASARR